jgi:hypothetical protein
MPIMLTKVKFIVFLPHILLALKLRSHNTRWSVGHELSPCLKKAAKSVQDALLQDHCTKFTMQATCHSFSEVNKPPEGLHSSKVMSFLQCNQFYFDKGAQTLSVEPGVRYVDVIPTLRKEDLFLTHGNYGGQTIVGMTQTGTHGSGVISPHNL